jgi:hypothetical protein
METTLIITAAVVVFLVLVFICSSKKENYGPMKDITRNIPKSACRDICLQHYHREMAEFGHLNADWVSKKYHSCINVCEMSSHFRT